MQLIAHKIVPPTTFPRLSASKIESHAYSLGLSFCPSMDLIATYPLLSRINLSSDGSDDQQYLDSEDEGMIQHGNTGDQQHNYGGDEEDTVNVDVWRFNGQRVFSVAIDSEDEGRVEVKNVEWRSDGQIIAILSSDRVIRLVSSFSGKVVHRFSSLPTYAAPASPKSPRVTRSSDRGFKPSARPKSGTLSFTTHFSNSKSTQTLLHTATTERSVVLDDLLGLNADIASLLKSPADLPRELANIDVESFLPRLSCLPPVGFGSEDVFSTRTSIDTIFHSSKKNVQSGIVDVLVAGHGDGMVGIRIFDSFEIGGIDLNSALAMRKGVRIDRVLKMASWPFLNDVYVVAQDMKGLNLHLLSVDLKFITKASNSLPVLATKATQLQNLLRYLSQIQTQLARELKTAFDLPTKYLRNVNEDLEKEDGPGASFATAAYHAIATGEISGAFKDWLNEQVGDRGVKRWEKSVGDCLELVRRLLSEAWCPAVERAGVVISRLSGLAGWHTQDDSEAQGLGLDRKLIDGLRETVDVMAISGEECLKEVIKEVDGFASFIKWLKWEVEASALEDTSERLDEMRESSDHGDVLKVLEYIDYGPQGSLVKQYINADLPNATNELDHDLTLYARFKEHKKKNGSTVFQSFDQLLTRMRGQCDNLFEQIAQSLRQGVMTSYITPLHPEIDTRMLDTRVVSEIAPGDQLKHHEVHILARKNDDKTKIVQQTIELEGSCSKTSPTRLCELQPPEAGEVLAVRFVDDQFFMALVRNGEDIRIYSHYVKAGYDEMWELRHTFKSGIMEAGMSPCTLVINGRKKRRVVGVTDKDMKGYAIYDLDSGDKDEEDETMTG